MKSGKFSLKDTKRFDKGDFYGLVYFEQNGLEVMEIHVDGVHPEKLIDKVDTRMYRVEEGTGTFVIDGESYTAEPGDVFVIYKGGKYSYTGKMKMFEVNLFS